MSKFVYTALTIIAIAAIMGTFTISVDAAGKPTKTITDTINTFENVNFCATISKAIVNTHIENTVDGDEKNWKQSVTVKGELIEDNTNELIGAYHSKFVRIGNFDSDDVTVFNINIVINCFNGEKNENAHDGFTITRDGELHHHGPTSKE